MKRKSVIACGVSLSVLMLAGAAFAQQRIFDVPGGPAIKSIPEFARQAGIQIIAPADQLGGIVTPAVTGAQDARAALRALLAGTSLEIASDDGSVIALRNAKPRAAPDPAPAVNNVGASLAAPSASEIVVTGSRVITNGNNSPTPVTIVTTEVLQNVHPTTLIDALNDLPVFSGSRGQMSNPSPGLAGSGAPASNQLNIRNLGANRTLILFDGQRVAPTTINQVVDSDIIPQMLIQRVDIVTGGVSAIYGSDAMSGVVNFVPDTHFNGMKLEAEAGASQYGDNRTWKAGIAVGTALFGGRGHIEASYEHYDDAGILDRWSPRTWNDMFAVTGAGTAANPYVLNANVRANNSTFGGLINGAKTASNPLGGMEFLSNGVLTPFVHGVATGTSTAEVGGDGAYNEGSMVSPLRMDQFYIRGDYELTDTIHAHVQASRDLKLNSQLQGWAVAQSYTMSATNPYLPAAYQAQMAAAKQTAFTFSETINQAPQLKMDAVSDQYIVNGGLDGTLGKYKWGLAVDYGISTLADTFHNEPNLENLSAALDAVVNPANGQIVCRSTLTNPGLRPDCTPLNLFGPSTASAAAIAYIFRTTHYTSHTSTYDVSGNFTGSPFSTWAGPVNTAVSAEWRREAFDSSTDASALALANCTGIQFSCNSSTVEWQDTLGAHAPIGVNVWETALEADAPLVKDMPFFQSFNLNGAARYMNYSTKGSYWAWKIGMDWHVDDQLRFRGTVSRDIRAPNLYELFAAASYSGDQTQDTLTGATPNITSFRAGNPNLVAEIGDTKTIGFVFRPRWAPSFSLSVDAFHIMINNAIVEVKGDSAIAQSGCYASGGASVYCTLQSRPLGFTNTSLANTVTAWYQYNINIASVESYGADIEANYAGRLFDHQYSLRAFTTWQPHTVYTQPGNPSYDMGGTAAGPIPLTAQPALRMTGTESFAITDGLRLDLVERYRSALRLSGTEGQYVACCVIAPVTYMDVNLSYKISAPIGQSELFFNVQNLLDQNPPPFAFPGKTVPGSQSGGWVAGDDPIGRAFMFGVRFKH